VKSKIAYVVVSVIIILGVFSFVYENQRNSIRVTNTPGFVAEGEWLTYHHDNQRTGFLNVSNSSNYMALWKTTKLDGQVYAEPLLFGGMLFVVTENNTVYSINATSGRIIWKVNLGRPVSGSELPCGNIDPSGITSTPVINPKNGYIYVVTFLQPPHHVLVALDTKTGKVRFYLNADPPGSDPSVEQQRGALALANNMVYIPYGGLFGDCGKYRGYIVALHSDGSPGLRLYVVPTSREGGIWAPSGLSVSKDGDIFATTGNGESSLYYDHGNSVVKLDPELNEIDYFAPENWLYLNSNDIDLGSTGPALIGNDRILQIGKQGIAYLLNASRLGGIGGELSSLKVCNSAFGGTAYDGTAIYVPCVDGLYKVEVAGKVMKVKWGITGFSAGPPIVTGSIVWTVDHASGKLLGFDSLTGKIEYDFEIGMTNRFTTPTAGLNAVYVASDYYAYCFIAFQ
jgi:outer membrane protein assembly factor BamB